MIQRKKLAMSIKRNFKYLIAVSVVLSLILWLVCFSDGLGQYIGLNYSEKDILLINITKDSLKTIFDKKDSTKTIEWKSIWQDSSCRVIIINPSKRTFHNFWYPICTQPYSKLIVDGKWHEPILLLRHEIRVGRKTN